MIETRDRCKEWKKQAAEELFLVRDAVRSKIKETESVLRDLQAAERILLQYSEEPDNATT